MVQQDYRIFVGAFPTGELAQRIQALRLRLDPVTARITPPHVTLAGTYWRSGLATPENEAVAIADLQLLKDKIAPFHLILGGVSSFLPLTAVLFLQVAVTPELLAVRSHLLDVLGPDKHRRFTPHLTIAMRLKQARTRALLRELRQSEWHTGRWSVAIHELWLMQRGPADPSWRRISTIPLGG